MGFKGQTQLLEAKEHFFSWRLLEAYAIFRRYFDRIPFKPEKEHAEYIGMYVRTLAELGKDRELQFYVPELERHYSKTKDAWIGFTLGVVYYHLSPPRMEAARALFEEVAADPKAKNLHARARMFLANYYDRKGDFASCRRCIESIEDVEDPRLRPLVEIWQAVLLAKEEKFIEAERLYSKLVASLDPQRDWYAYASAKLGLAVLYLKKKDSEKSAVVLAEVRKLFEGRHFKSIQVQLKALESQMDGKEGMRPLLLEASDKDLQVTYDNRTVLMKQDSPSEKLLQLLVQKRFLDKQSIVTSIYGRQYNGEQDDKLIYYHIHVLRKRLKEIGVPSAAIASESSGYRFLPEVKRG